MELIYQEYSKLITVKIILYYNETPLKPIGSRLWRAIQQLYRNESRVIAIAMFREIFDYDLITAKEACDFISDHEWRNYDY